MPLSVETTVGPILGAIIMTIIWASVIFLYLAVPFVEEVFFRGFAYPAFKRLLPPLPSILLVSAFFVLWHSKIFKDPLAIPSLFLYSSALTVFYEKTRSLTLCIITHLTTNVTVFTISTIIMNIKVI